MPLLDRDEPRFSRATVEMEQRGTWVVPYFNDEYRFDKPPLTYWWMRVNYAIFGHNELGARMHSIVSSALVALLILAVGRDMFGWRVGFWAAFAWLTLFQVWQHGRLAVADMPMVLFLALAHWALWRMLACESPRRWGVWFWTLWLSLSLGFLAKGPLVFFGAGFTLLLVRFVFWRKPLDWARLQLVPGAAICLVPIAMWGLPALEQTGGLFWQQGMGKHVVDRGLGAFNDRMTIPVLYYLVTALVSLFPWLGRLGSLWASAREGRTDLRFAFLLSWALGPYLIFAFYATQLPHYVLPGFPALMLLFFARPGMAPRWSRRFFAGYHALWGLLIIFLAGWLLLGPVRVEVKPMMLGLCALLMGLQFVALNFESRRASRIGMGVAMISLGSVLAGLGLQRVALSPIVADYAEGVDGRLAALGYTEPSLVYYAGRSWDMYASSAQGVDEALESGAAMIVVFRRQLSTNTLLGFDKKEPQDSDYSEYALKLLDCGYVRSRVEGLNIARFSWATLDIYTRP